MDFNANSIVITQFTGAKVPRFKLLLPSQSISFKYKPLQQINIQIVRRKIHIFDKH